MHELFTPMMELPRTNLPAISETIGRPLLTGTITLALVGVLCRLLERILSANLRCQLWRLTYVKLLLGLLGIALLIRLPAPIASVAVSNAVPSTTSPIDMAPRAADATVHGPSPAYAAATAAETAAPAPAPPVVPEWTLAALLTAVYLLGFCLCAVRVSRSLWRTRRILSAARPVADDYPELIAEFGEVGERLHLRRLPRLCAANVACPFYAPGAIVLPTGFLGNPDIRLILAHELAHVRRRDLAWEWLGIATQTLLFFHPLVHLARREERIARESAVDALALDITGASAAKYGRLLLDLALRSPGPFGAAAAIGVIDGGDGIRRRLRALQHPPFELSGPRLWWARGLAAVLVTGAVTPLAVARGHDRIRGEDDTASIPVSTRIGVISPAKHALVAADTTARERREAQRSLGRQRIVGVIRDENGRPVVAGVVLVEMHIKKLGNQTMKSLGERISTKTNPDGAFQFDHLLAGGFYVGASTHDGKFVSVNVLDVTLKPGQKQESLALRMPHAAAVHGRVTRIGSGTPIENLLVTGSDRDFQAGKSQTAEKSEVAADCLTDRDGRYTLLLPVTGGYAQVGRAYTATSVRLAGMQSRWIARPGMAGTQSVDFEVRVSPSLTVLDSRNQPVADAAVSLSWASSMHHPTRSQETDGRGAVELPFLDPGDFTVSLDGRSIGGSFQLAADGSVTVGLASGQKRYPDGRAIVHLTDTADAYLIGRVVTADNNAVPNAILNLQPLNRADPRYAVPNARQYRANADGRFRLPLSIGERYSLFAYADGFNQIVVLNEPSFQSHAGEVRDLGNVTLVPATGSISGRIVDDRGRPVRGALLCASAPHTYRSLAATDSKGSFRLAHIVDGETVQLEICRRGETADGRSGGFESGNSWTYSGLRGGMTDLRIPLRPEDLSKTVPIESLRAR